MADAGKGKLGMKVRLTKAQLSQCTQAGSFRSQLSRMAGVKNQKMDNSRVDTDIDILGAKAELAVALVFDADFSINRMGIDDGCDLFLHDIGVDVKSTFYQTGKMLFKSKEAFRADVCVLATATNQPNEICVVGWLPRKQFLEIAKQSDDGKYHGWAVEQDKLRPLEELWHIYKERELSG